VPATRIRIDTNHRGSENNNIATRIEGVAGQIPGDRNMLSASTIASSLALAALLAGAALAQPLLAPTSPMGWNSWDSFGTGVTEAELSWIFNGRSRTPSRMVMSSAVHSGRL
jgi:hypothetical protein